MRQDYLKRFGIDACLDDVRVKTEHIKVVCEVEILLLNNKCAAYFGSQKI